MEANLTPAAPATEPPPESATTPKTLGGPTHEQALDLLGKLLESPRELHALQAINNWRELRHEAANLSMEADKAERAGFLASQEKTEAGRKAAGQLAAAAKRLVADHVDIDAQAAGRLVDLLVGPSVVVRR
jgi:hypothetical protein